MRLIVALLLLLASGCLFSSEPSRTFTLETSEPRTKRALEGPPITLEAVTLPPAIEREELVLYEAPGRLEVRELDLWAAPPRSLVLRTLATDLARRAPEGRVLLPGQALPEGPTRPLHVVIERFAAGPGAVVILDAVWTLGAGEEGKGDEGASSKPLGGREHVEVGLASSESDAVAAGMSAALGGLADRIVARIDGAGR